MAKLDCTFPCTFVNVAPKIEVPAPTSSQTWVGMVTWTLILSVYASFMLSGFVLFTCEFLYFCNHVGGEIYSVVGADSGSPDSARTLLGFRVIASVVLIFGSIYGVAWWADHKQTGKPKATEEL